MYLGRGQSAAPPFTRVLYRYFRRGATLPASFPEVFVMVYLDHAATTPIPRPVADAMYQVLAEQFANPSAQYAAGL